MTGCPLSLPKRPSARPLGLSALGQRRTPPTLDVPDVPLLAPWNESRNEDYRSGSILSAGAEIKSFTQLGGMFVWRQAADNKLRVREQGGHFGSLAAAARQDRMSALPPKGAVARATL